jgi:hypothetical protein
VVRRRSGAPLEAAIQDGSLPVSVLVTMNVNGAGKVILMALSISYNLEALLFSCGS